ncbi:50S ribosomal protein L25 [Paenibacillus alvei]|uniref:50S ribosomal protein L25 n=1 Tax=Paenibacillus alvei TaxID=44250 RepID=A0ABT4E703_PAEAL|nr:50S ribosomal protein L25 [Paenibacillus alvei]MCY9528273.1 50S ribosomal protein L25 [Paenibacillus alvei]
MMQHFQAVTRNSEDRGALRQLRKDGRLPCVLLHKGTSVNLHLDEKKFSMWVRDTKSSQLELSFDGADPITATVKEIQRHPVTNDIVHADLLRV